MTEEAPKTKLLRVTTSHFVAGVVFEKVSRGVWKPVRAAPILAWMLAHEDHAGIAAYLNGPGKRNGWFYKWTEKSNSSEAEDHNDQ